MKKIIYVFTLLLVFPMIAFAANGNGISGTTTSDDITGKLGEVEQAREQLQVFEQTKDQIQEQTREQLQTSMQEMLTIKEQVKTEFAGLKDLTAEEREALRDEILKIKEEVKTIHIAALELRDALVEEVSITDEIDSVSSDVSISDTEAEVIQNVIDL